ncbi:hypothetical protein ABEY43_07030 [Priestia megaterium]
MIEGMNLFESIVMWTVLIILFIIVGFFPLIFIMDDWIEDYKEYKRKKNYNKLR